VIRSMAEGYNRNLVVQVVDDLEPLFKAAA
jgi:hypothetical protein